MASTSEATKEHIIEIQRRKEVASGTAPRDAAPRTSHFGKSSSSTPSDFDLDDQAVLLYSVSHTGFRPYSHDGAARIRLYGAFADAEEAAAHASAIQAADAGADILLAPMREWIAVVATPELATTQEYVSSLRDRLLQRYASTRDVDDAEFRSDRKDEQRGKGSGERGSCEQGGGDKEGSSDDDDDETNAPPRPLPPGAARAKRSLPASARVAGQRFVVVSCICAPDDELIFKAYAFFDDLQECDAWVRNVASARVQDVHLDIASSCAWMCPSKMRSEDAPKEVYRNSELDGIIQYHRTEPDRVSEYREWAETTGADASVQDSATIKEEEERVVS